MDVEIDCRSGRVRLKNGNEVELSPGETAVLFWITTGTPMSRLSSLTGQAEDVLAGDVTQLSRKLDVREADLPHLTAHFAQGAAPRPSKPWRERTMANLLKDTLYARDPDDVFLLDARGEEITVGEILKIMSRIRAGLRSMGVQRGDIIAADSTLTLETYFINLAAWSHGCGLIRLNSSGPDQVIREQVERTPPKLVFSSRLDAFRSRSDGMPVIALSDETEPGFESAFSDWVGAAPEPADEDRVPALVGPTDICLISSTSGTTGHPKAVMLSQHAVWWGCDRAFRMGDFDAADVFSSATDFVGDCSTYVLTGIPLIAGAKVVIPRPVSRQSPLDFMRDCVDYRVTCPFIVPSALKAILVTPDRISAAFYAQLRILISSSAPLGEPLARRFRSKSDAPIIEYLGSREYGGSLAARTAGTDVISSGGGFANETLVRIVDAEGRACGANEIGTLMVMSLGTMDGYVLPKSQSNGATHRPVPNLTGYELWYDTADLACYTAGGGIQVKGRSSDMMKAPDGQIVLPIEIENILHTDDRVREACVFSLKDATGLEVIAGAVIPNDHVERSNLDFALRETVLGVLGHLKTPTALLISDSFPRAAQNKPDRNKLKSLFSVRMADDAAQAIPVNELKT